MKFIKQYFHFKSIDQKDIKQVLKPNLHNHYVKSNGTARVKLHQEQRLQKNIYLNTQDVYLQFEKVNDQLRTLNRKFVRFVEREISNKAKHNPKAFSKYVNHKRTNKVMIPSLYIFGNKEEFVKSCVDKADTLAS